MTKKRIIALALVAAVALFFLVRIIRNALTSEEAKIKKLIRELASDFEEKKIKRIFKHISEDYTDEGDNTKDRLREYAGALFRITNEADVSIRDLIVVVAEDEKTAEAGFVAKVHLVTILVESTDALTDGIGDNKVRLYLRKENGDWVVYKSNFKRFRENF